jgi:hypothetical protein
MERSAPVVLRKGSLVRVSGWKTDTGSAALAHAFLDLRFPDGHVERWLGHASVGTLPGGPDAMQTLQRWAAGAADEFAFDVACDVAQDFKTRPPAVDHLPCDEVVIEWNHPPPDREPRAHLLQSESAEPESKPAE